jgi:cytochrome P450
LKSELSPLFGKSNLIWDDLKNRTYFEAFIKETLRIYGPAIGI